MSGGIIFECPHKGELVRFQVGPYRGSVRANIRRWFQQNGEWKPGNKGCTLPPECLPALTVALLKHHGVEVPEALQALT